MRFDNGHPWGTTSKVPSALALWLVGIGIQPVFGRPRQSTDNAVVERSHGILNGWIEPTQCADFDELTKRVAEFTYFQRAQYPVSDGKSRLELYPELLACPRRYEAGEDKTLWSKTAVLDYLSTFGFQRKVEVNGRVTLLSREYFLGRDYKRQTVSIHLDKEHEQWVFCDDYGAEIKRLTPIDLNYQTISQMTLAYRKRKT